MNMAAPPVYLGDELINEDFATTVILAYIQHVHPFQLGRLDARTAGVERANCLRDVYLQCTNYLRQRGSLVGDLGQLTRAFNAKMREGFVHDSRVQIAREHDAYHNTHPPGASMSGQMQDSSYTFPSNSGMAVYPTGCHGTGGRRGGRRHLR